MATGGFELKELPMGLSPVIGPMPVGTAINIAQVVHEAPTEPRLLVGE
jgi:hypothetical protein